jgi:phosphoenolpyruvate carboxykinase (GTP)
MVQDYKGIVKERLDQANWDKIERLDNPAIVDFIGEYISLCNPDSVFVRGSQEEDFEYVRKKAVSLGEEKELSVSGHSVHFDGFFDQARDKKNTRYLVDSADQVPKHTNSIQKAKGLEEVRSYLKNIYQGKEMIVAFFCLGPVGSEFSVLAVQITDSFYVAHSEDILYRPGYKTFQQTKPENFFKFVHSAGELDENKVSKNIEKRRVYINLDDSIVYSTNTQYAGNTVGLKKLALRLAIKKATNEGWLAEHMFVMGIKDFEGNKSYFCGAYPSMCGKTSTSMVQGESILGDDIAYLKIRQGKVYGVNVERGIFGIIKDVNEKDDPIIFKALNSPGERIFSNVLVDDNRIPFWIGKQKNLPHKGVNFAGAWYPGVTDSEGEEIPLSHKNARYTIGIKSLDNADENLDNPRGVEVEGLIYGGRDSDTWVPVEEAFSWEQGIITKAAALESETTAATLGREGIRVFNPMSNMDFLSVPLSEYVSSNLSFGKRADKDPLIFSVNYFLKDKAGKFLNDMEDKRVWLKWMCLRVKGKVKALRTPTGLIPLYEDLRKIFKKVLNKEYMKEDYVQQFTLRIPENMDKIERITNIYRGINNIPDSFFKELEEQARRLEHTRDEFGDYVSPEYFK